MFGLVKHILFIIIIILIKTGYGQLVTDESITEFQSVNILAGSLTTSNIAYSGDQTQIGSFNGVSSNIGLASGVLLSTFNIDDAVGPNNLGVGLSNYWVGGSWSWSNEDLDLTSLSNTSGTSNSGRSAAVLEFDVVAIGDSLSIRYVYASEEYNAYVCGSFNDAAAIFISGPGINGNYANNAKIISTVPNSSAPVMTNTINGGVITTNFSNDISYCNDLDPNWQSNTGYYFDNTGGSSVQFNGWTVPLEAVAAVQSGQTYHIKIAVQNSSDAYNDTGFFIDSLYFKPNTSPCTFVDPNFPDTLAFCSENGLITLDAGNPGFNYLWIPGGETTQTIQTLIPGDYSVLVSGNGCPDSTLSVFLKNSCACTFVDPNFPETLTFCPDDGVVTLDAGNPGFNYLWIPDGETTQTIQTLMPGAYSVQITNNWCPVKNISLLILKNCDTQESSTIVIPNVVTPNSDGYNDVFIIEGDNISEYELSIFNRWGTKLFSTNDKTKGWNATFKGSLVPEGSYFYILNVKVGDETIRKKGTVTVLK